MQGAEALMGRKANEMGIGHDGDGDDANSNKSDL